MKCIKNIVCVLLLIILASCSKTEEPKLDKYNETIQSILNTSEFDEAINYNIEVLYDQENNSFYVIIDEINIKVTDIAVVAVPVVDGERVGQAPQIGLVDEKVTLGNNQKGLILTGEVDNFYDNLEMLLKIECLLDGEISVDFIKIQNIVLIG